MKCGMITKASMGDLIMSLPDDTRFYGPVRTGDTVDFAPIESGHQMVFDYVNTARPAKLMFFPLSEDISRTAEGRPVSSPLPVEKKILFGLRPCDAASLKYLDKVFLDRDCIDPYYQARRDNAVVIALACDGLQDTCFCTGVEGHPEGRDGADILARNQGSEFLFEAVSAAGEEFMQTHADKFAETPVPAAGETAFRNGSPGVSMDDVDIRLGHAFEKAAWDGLSEPCLSCGACTYLCPTCHCFAIHDETGKEGGARIRVHDGCQYAAFTGEASGHNPRDTVGARMRQRIMHKFCYTRANFGDIFCVGCGRCIEACPVNIDIRDTLFKVVS